MVSQYWRMIQAHNLEEFIAANSALQMPFFNVIYADRDGHILYVFGGQQPMRQGGDWGKYSGILDGSDPSLLWTDTFAWFDLPRAIDPPGGFVANSNNPPWTSTFNPPGTPTFPQTLDPAHFPAYISPQFMDLRAQHGAIILQSRESDNYGYPLGQRVDAHAAGGPRAAGSLWSHRRRSSIPQSECPSGSPSPH